jgi:hypothetical protein
VSAPIENPRTWFGLTRENVVDAAKQQLALDKEHAA